MKVNGYMLREAIKMHELRRDTAAAAFLGSLKKFENETKSPPGEIVAAFLAAEDTIAKLQMVQARYNLHVAITVRGARITLAEAVKRLGGMSRVEKMWRSATGAKIDRYAFNADERNPGMLVAKPTIATTEAMKLAEAAAKATGEYRAAIATGNAHEFEAETLDPKLFD
jgi:hypothetical protein